MFESGGEIGNETEIERERETARLKERPIQREREVGKGFYITETERRGERDREKVKKRP